nr:unnamed protein product [Spirometra erinaceieuropaei]
MVYALVIFANSTLAASTAVGGSAPDQSALEKTLQEFLLHEEVSKGQVNERTNTLRSQNSVTPSELECLCEANIAGAEVDDDEAESLRSDVTNLTNAGLRTLYLKERNQPYYRIGRLQRTISTSSQLGEISSISGTQSPISEDCVENWEYFAEAVQDLQNCLRDLVPGEAESELAPPELVAENTVPAICVISLADEKAVPPIPEKSVNSESTGKETMDYLGIDPSGGQRWSLASSGIHDDDDLSKMTVYGVPDTRVERQLYSVDGVRRSSFETVYHPPEATEQLVLQKAPEPIALKSINIEEVAVGDANEPRSPEMRRYTPIPEVKTVHATGTPTAEGEQLGAQQSETNQITHPSPPQSISLTTSISTLISSPTSNLTIDPGDKLDSKSSSPETTKTLSMRSNHDYDSDDLRRTTSSHQEGCSAAAPEDGVAHRSALLSPPSVSTDVGGNESQKGPARHTLSSHPKPCVHARLQSATPSLTCRQSDVALQDSPAGLSQMPTDVHDLAQARKTQAAQGEQSFSNGDYNHDKKNTPVVSETSSARPIWTGSKIVIKANSLVPRKPRKSGIYKRTPENLTQAPSLPTSAHMWTEQPPVQINNDAYRAQPSLTSQSYAPCAQEPTVQDHYPPEGSFSNGHIKPSSRVPVSNFNPNGEPLEEGDEDLDSEWMRKLEHIAKWQREVHQAMQNVHEYDFCVSTPPPMAPIDNTVDRFADFRADDQGFPIRMDGYDDDRRMKHRAGLEPTSYSEKTPGEVARPANRTSLGTNGAPCLDSGNQARARVLRQPLPCSAQSSSNLTPLTVRQDDDLQNYTQRIPCTGNGTFTYQDEAVRKNGLELADSTALHSRDNFSQKYTTNGGATFVPNKSASLTKAADAAQFSARSTFPMPPTFSSTIQKDRETFANHAYSGGNLATQVSNNWPGRQPTQTSIPYKRNLTGQNPTDESSKPIFTRRNPLQSTVLQRHLQPSPDFLPRRFQPNSLSPIQSGSNTVSPQTAYAEALSMATAATAAVEAAVNQKTALDDAFGYRSQNHAPLRQNIHRASGERAVNKVSVNLRPPRTSSASIEGLSMNGRIPGSMDCGIQMLGRPTTQSASPAVRISERRLCLGERRSQSVGPSVLPPPADANLYPLVTDLSRGLRAIQHSTGSSSERTPVQALRPQKFILGRVSSNEDICIQTETPFAFSIASTGKNICIAKVSLKPELPLRDSLNSKIYVLQTEDQQKLTTYHFSQQVKREICFD